MQKVYLDNAATTKVRDEVVEAMLPYFTEYFGNPSSLHLFAREAGKGLDTARAQVAKALNAKPEEIIFTGGGSESDNMVLRGIPEAYKKKGKHVITSAVEHHAVLHTLEAMEKEGRVEVTYLPVDEYGMVTAEQVEKAIRPDTVLVSIMFANNEVGTIMPIEQIGETCKKYGVLFHTDAVQAVGHVPVDVEKMHIDLLSLSGHKFHGPKGVGLLYVGERVKIQPIVFGGGQQQNLRSGTENVPGIAGLAKAAEMLYSHFDEDHARLCACKRRFIEGVERLDQVKVNGLLPDAPYGEGTAAHIVSVSFAGVRSEVLLHALEDKGIYVSAGSACSAHKPQPSATLKAIGIDKSLLDSTIRFSFSVFTTEEEIDVCLQALYNIVPMLRRYSRR